MGQIQNSGTSVGKSGYLNQEYPDADYETPDMPKIDAAPQVREQVGVSNFVQSAHKYHSFHKESLNQSAMINLDQSLIQSTYP